MLNPYPKPQLKGYVPSHNSRNTNKPTFEISSKPCRPRTSKTSKNTLFASALSPGTALEPPGETRFQIAWRGTRVASANPSPPLCYVARSSPPCRRQREPPLQCNKKEDSWECGYYVMSWIRTIIRAAIKDEWIEAVSYTHRDVYKRQIKDLIQTIKHLIICTKS
ncbi:hypothetical protein DEO72_LG6g1385 [Vigna unguiculata]|uniref:Uncharacterized protein n=1 Tax=Vigna unguiculata TaxID=3917 RepID=A0A4D6M844_VIGUN|nr:hypothetical protein DEO72_LG6g1385 [Vigna unguiculata]